MPVEAWHVEHVAAAMREGDRTELRVLNNIAPREALDVTLAQRGEHWSGLIDGVPAVIFGVVPLSLAGGAGVIWLLGTDAVTQHRRLFLRASREVVARFFEQYDVLVNVVHVENRVALRWLQWLGATFKRNGDRIYFELKRPS